MCPNTFKVFLIFILILQVVITLLSNILVNYSKIIISHKIISLYTINSYYKQYKFYQNCNILNLNKGCLILLV